MPTPLDPDFASGRKDRRIERPGTRELGPSDSSDTGADLHGADGLADHVDGFGLDRAPTNEDERSTAGHTAGPDVGDANLDSDSDRSGTGEGDTTPRDMVAADGADIDTDHVEGIPPDAGAAQDDLEEEKRPLSERRTRGR